MTIFTPTAGPNARTVPRWEEEMGQGKLGGETTLGREDQGGSSPQHGCEAHSGCISVVLGEEIWAGTKHFGVNVMLELKLWQWVYVHWEERREKARNRSPGKGRI